MTYSIVARDRSTGELGVAVQSHYFAAGSVVAWAEAGVGAIATQSIADVRYGVAGLAQMRAGESAGETLECLMAADVQANLRQVGMVDAAGNVAVHTGSGCIGYAGHCEGDQVVAQANMMVSPTVYPAMVEAYLQSGSLDFPARLLRALQAAQDEGGDARGQQAAALVVVTGERSETPWQQKRIDIRVDHSSQPLQELQELLEVSLATELQTDVFDSGILFQPGTEIVNSDLTAALAKLAEAQQKLGENTEPTFWSAVLRLKVGDLLGAQQMLAAARSPHADWHQFLSHIVDAGVLPAERLVELERENELCG